MIQSQYNFKPTQNALEGKAILVTGASDGIGKAVALSYASLGASVVLLGRSQEKLEAVYDEVVNNGWATPILLPFDLEKAVEEDYQQVADAIEQQLGQLDGLLHNAGVLGELTLIEHYKPSTWMQVMQINVNSQFLLTRALLPLLRKNPNGSSIIFTSSSVGRQGRAHWGAYSVSKFATEGFMQTLSDELANTSKVRVNSINPGATQTKMRAQAYPAEPPEKNRKPTDILGTYLYLMCDDSKGVTGHCWDAQPKKS